MKHTKIALFLLSTMLFILPSCSKEDPNPIADDKGIQVITTRGSSTVTGIGVACDFKELFEKYKDVDEEINDKLDSLDSGDLEDILDEIFNKQRTMYMVFAGEDLDVENEEFTGEVFSLVWFTDAEPEVGVYEAGGMRLNIQDPGNLKEDADAVGSEKIAVTLVTITDTEMIGDFSGTYINKAGQEEEISGSFNVYRKVCGE